MGFGSFLCFILQKSSQATQDLGKPCALVTLAVPMDRPPLPGLPRWRGARGRRSARCMSIVDIGGEGKGTHRTEIGVADTTFCMTVMGEWQLSMA
jgi:hypothetical protein